VPGAVFETSAVLAKVVAVDDVDGVDMDVDAAGSDVVEPEPPPPQAANAKALAPTASQAK
jgi:hypothetical protein